MSRRRTRTMGPMLPFFERPRTVTNGLRDAAMEQVADHAEDEEPGFADEARAFVIAFLARYGPAPAEHITDACKRAGIVPHDDRAFGPVYMTLARREQIVKVGSVRRERGHGTAGGNVWALREAS